MKPIKLIDEVRLIVAEDSDDDREGVVAYRMPSGEWMPLISADMDRFHNIERLAMRLSSQLGQTFKVISLTGRKVIGEIDAKGARYEHEANEKDEEL